MKSGNLCLIAGLVLVLGAGAVNGQPSNKSSVSGNTVSSEFFILNDDGSMAHGSISPFARDGEQGGVAGYMLQWESCMDTEPGHRRCLNVAGQAPKAFRQDG